MKQSPATRKIYERMAAGVLCRDGFLADDPRPLEEILDTDRSAVEGFGTTHEELADRLGRVLQAAMLGLGTAVKISDRLTATYRETMGRIPCPWGTCGTFAKGEVELTDGATGERLFFTPLTIHLIAAHGFYQGRGSRYRLDPATIHRML